MDVKMEDYQHQRCWTHDWNQFQSCYQPNNDIFREDNELLHALKVIIFEKLSETDRRILLLYAETMSMKKTGKLLRVSASTVFKAIKRIRNEVISGLKPTTNNI